MKYEIFKCANLADHIGQPDYRDHIICLVDTGYFYTYDKHPMFTTYTSYHKEKLKLEEEDALLLIDLFNQDIWYDRISEYTLDADGTVILPEFGKVKLNNYRNSGEGYKWKSVEED